MKKIKVKEPVKVKGLFGTKTVMKEKTIKVDRKTYKAMKQAEEEDAFNRLLILDEILSDD